MKKGWKYRLSCKALALVMAGMEPAAIFAAEMNPTETQSAWAAEESASEEQFVAKEQVSEEQSEEEKQAAEERAAAEKAAAEEQERIDAYFEGSVFVGDSVMAGYGNYAMRRGGPCLGQMQFLAAVSFSVFNALRPVTAKSTHPLYQGQKRYVWESLGLMQPKRVFMFFGINDIDMGPLESTCSRYAQVIANIKENCPDAEIHIMSMTYIRPGKEQGRLNNPTIRQFNDMLRQMALDNGWGFADVANPLADANGNLAAVYCSDNNVHLTAAAYDVWTAVLREYARSQIEGTCMFPATGKKPQDEEAQALEAENAEQQGQEEAQASSVIGSGEEADQTGPGVVPKEEASAEDTGKSE